jgi:hypothetical protein
MVRTFRKNLTDHPILLIAYEDTIPGLTELKRYVNILALSNGNFRSLLDLVIESPHYESNLSFNQRYRQRTKVFPGMVYFHLNCLGIAFTSSSPDVCAGTKRFTNPQHTTFLYLLTR